MKTETEFLTETVVSGMRVHLKVGGNLIIREPLCLLNEWMFDRL